MNQVLQAPSVQGGGITSDARSHYRGGKCALVFFFPSGSLQARQPKSRGSPSLHLIQTRCNPLARFSERLHSSARGAALHRRCSAGIISAEAGFLGGFSHSVGSGGRRPRHPPLPAGPSPSLASREAPETRARDLPLPSPLDPPGKLNLVARKALWAAGEARVAPSG